MKDISEIFDQELCDILLYISEHHDFPKKDQEPIDDGEDLQETSIISNFLRLSWVHKFQFLKQLLREFDLSTLQMIANLIYAVRLKLELYSSIEKDQKFNYDLILFDHDRMIDKKSFKILQQINLKWYRALMPTDKIFFLLELLKHTGGGLHRELFKYLQKLIFCRLTKYRKDRLSGKLKSPRDKKLENKPVDSEPNLCAKEQKKFAKLLNKWEKKLDKNNKKFIKFSQKIDGPLPKPQKKKNKKQNQEKVVAIPTDVLLFEANRIQYEWLVLLPLPIVKKIFSYLPKKDLKNVKNAGPYYKFAVKEMMDEMKASKALNKCCQKFKKKLGPELLESVQVNEIPEPYRSIKQKRIDKTFRRGAILEKIKKTKGKPKKCSDVVQIMREMEADDFDAFPRKLSNLPASFVPDSLYKDVNLYTILSEKKYSTPRATCGIISKRSTYAISGRKSDQIAGFMGEEEYEHEKTSISVTYSGNSKKSCPIICKSDN